MSLTAVRQLLITLIRLISTIIIARVFGPEGNGIYGLAILVPTLASNFFNFGAGTSATYFLSNGRIQAANCFNYVNKTALSVTLLSAVCYFIFQFFFESKIIPNLDNDLILLSLTIFPLQIINQYYISMLLGLQKYDSFNICSFIQPVVFFVGVLFLYFANVNVNVSFLMVLTLVSYFISFLSLYFLIKASIKKFSGYKVSNSNKEIGVSLREFLLFGLKTHINTLIAFLNNKVGFYFINLFLSPVQVGLYMISIQMSEKIWIVSQSVSVIAFSKLSSMEEDKERLNLFYAICRMVFYVSILLGLSLIVLGDYLILFLFGDQYQMSFEPIYYLLPGIISFSVCRVITNDIAARGKPEINAYTSVISLLLNIVLCVVLIKNEGMIGAAITTSVVYTSQLIISLGYYFIYIDKNIRYCFFDFKADKVFLAKIKQKITKGTKNYG